MRIPAALSLFFALTCLTASAEDKAPAKSTAPQSAAPKTLSDAERARVQSQIESLKQSKMERAHAAGEDIRKDAVRQGETIDKDLKQKHDRVDRYSNGMSWMYGPDAARAIGNAKKQQLTQQAAAEKAKIAREAQQKALRRAEAAKKSADNIDESVTGLKSQVSKDGKFGLQPQGSNLHVRNYGK